MKNRRSKNWIRDILSFTLVELIASMAILSIIGVVVFSITGQTATLWRRTTAKVQTFQSARSGFEAMTRNISQATLNTYWDYYDAQGNRIVNATAPGTTTGAATYGRFSELHFVVDQAGQLIPSGGVTHAIFFQAPLGYSDQPTKRAMESLLNAVGYYVEFNSDAGLRPSFISGPLKYRYRLMEMVQSSDDLSVYETKNQPGSGGSAGAWIEDALTDNNSRVLAENVIALVIRPMRASEDSANLAGLPDINDDYTYDSHEQWRGGGAQPEESHQLPPLLQVTMIAIDEESAARIDSGSSPPSVIVNALRGRFETVQDYEDDLEAVTSDLQSERIGYEVFTTVVGIRGSKWSRPQ